MDQESPVNAEGTQKNKGSKAKTTVKRRRKEIIPQTPPQHDNSAISDTSELTSSGRPKRRAAKVYALQFYAVSHILSSMYKLYECILLD